MRQPTDDQSVIHRPGGIISNESMARSAYVHPSLCVQQESPAPFNVVDVFSGQRLSPANRAALTERMLFSERTLHSVIDDVILFAFS